MEKLERTMCKHANGDIFAGIDCNYLLMYQKQTSKQVFMQERAHKTRLHCPLYNLCWCLLMSLALATAQRRKESPYDVVHNDAPKRGTLARKIKTK